MAQTYRLTDTGDLKCTTGMEIDETVAAFGRTARMGNDGIIKANEFDEITPISTQMSSRPSELIVAGEFIEPASITTLAGKGNGVDNYIDTETLCNSSGYEISVTFKYDSSIDNQAIFGLYYKFNEPRILNYWRHYFIRLYTSVHGLYFRYGYSTTATPALPTTRNLSAYVVDGGIYTATFDGATISLKDGRTGAPICSFTASIPMPPMAVSLYAEHYIYKSGRTIRESSYSYLSENTLYNFAIDGLILNEWDIDSGTDTLTNRYGNDRHISGDLTGFWVDSDL